MSEEKARRGTSFSILLLAELVALVAIGCAAVRLVLTGIDPVKQFEILGLRSVVCDMVTPFLVAAGQAQGALILIERWRGRGLPWGYGRWGAVFLVCCVPGMLVWLVSLRDGIWEDPTNLIDLNGFGTDIHIALINPPAKELAGVLVALRLGLSRDERTRAMVDAREWVGRILATALIVCFLGMTLFDSLGF